MDNQLVTKQNSLQQIVLSILAIVIVLVGVASGVYQLRTADPYVQKVLNLQGDLIQGHAIFQMNCAGCHGIEAHGRVGPSLRRVSEHKSRVSLIQQVISGQTPPMPQFQPSSQEMADLLSYLESL